MKKILLAMIAMAFIISCKKETEPLLRKNLEISISNKTDLNFDTVKLYSGAHGLLAFDASDSLLFSLKAFSDKTIRWRPKITTRTNGTFLFQISDDRKNDFGYIAYKEPIDGYFYKIDVLADTILIKLN
jgi:hypothetical protein